MKEKEFLMFANKVQCLEMLHGSYRKLKAHYYYNKNFIIIREKIATFESDVSKMDEIFCDLCNLIQEPSTKKSVEYVQALIDNIDYCVFPKKFVEKSAKLSNITVNTISIEKDLQSVNFFADIPIELMIIDTLWTVLLGKVAYEQDIITNDVYGNTISNYILYDNFEQNSVNFINFPSLRLFDIYFYKYCDWRNNAFSTLESNYKKGKNSILISLDIKSFYYNVKFDFDLRRYFKENVIIDQIFDLTCIIKRVYEKYLSIVKPYRVEFESFEKNEYPLPLGLFSSMLLANIYLSNFDKSISGIVNCDYYGRYVDDMLFCFEIDDDLGEDVTTILHKTLVSNNLLQVKGTDYNLHSMENMVIQKDKIKLLYIYSSESRTLIDLYNEKVRIIPSQINLLPDYDLKIEDFNEIAYKIENLGNEYKIRDIGNVNINGFKISRYFSMLAYKQLNINSDDKKSEKVTTEQIEKIDGFFVGNRGIEYYSNWMNYAYFLVLCRRYKELKQFYTNTKNAIENLSDRKISQDTFKRRKSILKKTRDSLVRHLDTCVASALSLDILSIEKNSLRSFSRLAHRLMHSNMFNNALVSLPIANFLEYDHGVSYTRMNVTDYGQIPEGFSNTHKIKWSPRFIHYEELLLSLFLYNRTNEKAMKVEIFANEKLIDSFYSINHIRNTRLFKINVLKSENGEYLLNKIIIPNKERVKRITTIAVGNLKMNDTDCTKVINDKWFGLTREKKQALMKLLSDAYIESDRKVDLIVLPELFIPIYWLKEVIEFSKRTQVAIVTGIQYVPNLDNSVSNYIASIFPFTASNRFHKNAFVYVREKNDYSPIEKEILAKIKKCCNDAKTPQYQIYGWKGLDISTFVCYEFTDISARALFKGKCDIIAAPVYNSDTTYFSNIIDSATRDLHTIIVQANNSVYGDSRITGPYDRDNKDIVKIKGGDNDHLIIGRVNLIEISKYQSDYYNNLDIRLESLRKGKKEKKETRTKPEIKKLSARFDNSRAKRKNKHP